MNVRMLLLTVFFVAAICLGQEAPPPAAGTPLEEVPGAEANPVDTAPEEKAPEPPADEEVDRLINLLDLEDEFAAYEKEFAAAKKLVDAENMKPEDVAKQKKVLAELKARIAKAEAAAREAKGPDGVPLAEAAFLQLKHMGVGAEKRILEFGFATKHHPMTIVKLLDLLGGIHTPDSAGMVQKYLKHPMVEVRIAAMNAIGAHGDERLIHGILPMMASEDEQLRRHATLILGKFGFKSSVHGLTQLLKSDYAHVQIAALETLRKYPQMRDMIVAPIAGLLVSDNAEVALEAAASLQAFKDKRGEEFFRKVLERKDYAFQEKVIEYAGTYKVKSAVPFLLKLLKEDDWQKRYAAVDALGKIGDPLALASLKVLFEKEKILAVRRAVGRAFYVYRHEDTVEFLKSKVKVEPDVDTRWFVVATLGVIGTDEALYPLIMALMDSDIKIRQTAVISLRAITSQNFGYQPSEASKDRDMYIRLWEQWYNLRKAPKPDAR